MSVPFVGARKLDKVKFCVGLFGKVPRLVRFATSEPVTPVQTWRVIPPVGGAAMAEEARQKSPRMRQVFGKFMMRFKRDTSGLREIYPHLAALASGPG